MMRDSSVALVDVVISRCLAPKGEGGALFVEDGVRYTEFRKFSISHSFGKSGGAIYFQSGVYNLYDGTIEHNTVEYEGGGIFGAEGAFVMLDTCFFSNNTAPNGDGGGIFMDISSNLWSRMSKFIINEGIRGGALFKSNYQCKFLRRGMYLPAI